MTWRAYFWWGVVTCCVVFAVIHLHLAILFGGR
jgi:hypothetical protein